MEQEEVQVTQEIKEEIIEKPKKEKSLTVVNENKKGWMIGKTIDERFRVATAWFNSKMVPAAYENPIQVLGAMELSLQLGIPPLVGLSKIAIINGNPAIWGEMPLALVRKSGLLKSIKESLFTKDGKVIDFTNPTGEIYMAICTVVRTDGSEVTTFFTMDDAKQAGLLGRKNVWSTYPRRMIQMRARSQALKDVFPDVLMGVAMAEYDFNTIPMSNSVRDVNDFGEEKRDAAAELEEKLKN